MDHRVSKDMISSGMTPSGQKNQKELGGSQYGSTPSPSRLMDAYKSIYEHHQKDENGNTVPHEEDIKEGKINPGLQAYLDKKKGKKGNGDDKEEKKGKGSKGSKPDFLDLDKDGDKKEPMKKASKEMKKEETEIDLLIASGKFSDAEIAKIQEAMGIFKEGIFKDPKLNKKYPNQPEMTQKGKRILPKLPDPKGLGSKFTKKTPKIFGDPTGEMSKEFFK